MIRNVAVCIALAASAMVVEASFAGPSSEPLDYREVRPKLFGPQIAATADYTVHSPQAVLTGGTVRCGAPASARMTDAQYNARLEAIRAELQAVNDAANREMLDLNRRYRTKEISEAQVAQLSQAIDQRKSEAATRAYEQNTKLDAEQRGSAQAASGNVAIYLVHAPADPNATIVPLNAMAAPAPAFLADLNRVLKSFLASCGDRPNVGVAHYFRDISLGAGRDVASGQMFETHVAAYAYSLRGGALVLNEPGQGTEKFRLFHDAEHNDLTLVAVRARWDKFHLVQADYRKDHADAAKRSPGIVYRLDAYWEEYTPDTAVGRSTRGYFDKVRRVFDGDFTLINRSQEFRVLFMDYGEVFTARCAAQVKSYVTYPIPNQVITRTKEYMDGHVEHEYASRPIPYRIDARFDPQWGQWYGDRNAYRSNELLQNMFATRGGKSFAQMTTSEFGARTAEFLELQMNTLAPVAAFFDRHSCTSATMTQLGENLLRAANGRPSLQKAGVRLPGAERESDPAVR